MKDTKKTKKWLDDLNLDHPLVIAGPCSAETEQQMLDIAHNLKNTDASVFRAGIWKPRTRPGNFEGVKGKGLGWLQRVKDETGMMVATEVGNSDHAELALQYDIDIIWIGARTTVNPFTVQEIADALRGTDRIVLIKNPVNPDYDLWKGSVERFYNVGIEKLGVIHRGFTSFKKGKYRNPPQWQIPIEMKSEFPNLPLICDPSHICGNRQGLFDVCQTALDLKFDGFMIETHNNPDEAWSDAAQQITPERLIEIMDELNVRKPKFVKDSGMDKLNSFRMEIDNLDEHLVQILGERMKISEKIGNAKKESNVSPFQADRWKSIKEKMAELGGTNKVSTDLVNQIFKLIHKESIMIQEKVINNK